MDSVRLIFSKLLKYFLLSNLFALLAKLLWGMPVKRMILTKERTIQRMIFKISISFVDDSVALTVCISSRMRRANILLLLT